MKNLLALVALFAVTLCADAQVTVTISTPSATNTLTLTAMQTKAVNARVAELNAGTNAPTTPAALLSKTVADALAEMHRRRVSADARALLQKFTAPTTTDTQRTNALNALP